MGPRGGGHVAWGPAGRGGGAEQQQPGVGDWCAAPACPWGLAVTAATSIPNSYANGQDNAARFTASSTLFFFSSCFLLHRSSSSAVKVNGGGDVIFMVRFYLVTTSIFKYKKKNSTCFGTDPEMGKRRSTLLHSIQL